jgi:isopenicillin N synthase-like dioxygenase
MHTYFDAMWALGDRLRDLCALSLRLPSAEADALASAFSSPTLTLTMNHYSAERSDPSAGVLGCGAHTDYGLLTILLMDDVPALQVARTKCGESVHRR